MKQPHTRTGYDTLDELSTTFSGDETDPLWHITRSWAGPDPRQALAENAELSPSDIADIDALLDRLDAHTLWARTTLSRIGQQPGITAAGPTPDPGA